MLCHSERDSADEREGRREGSEHNINLVVGGVLMTQGPAEAPPTELKVQVSVSSQPHGLGPCDERLLAPVGIVDTCSQDTYTYSCTTRTPPLDVCIAIQLYIVLHCNTADTNPTKWRRRREKTLLDCVNPIRERCSTVLEQSRATSCWLATIRASGEMRP